MVSLVLSYWSIGIIALFLCVSLLLFFSWRSKILHEKRRLQFKKDMLYEKEREISLRVVKKEHENMHLKEKISQVEEELSQKKWEEKSLQKEFFTKTEELFHTKNILEMEHKRVRESEEEKIQKEMENQSRSWNDHENVVISQVKYFCSQPKTNFIVYENTTLPPEFDGTLKPDVLIKFSNRYIVLDAKKSKNIKTYIAEQVKLTAQKYKEIDEVSRTLFFIVPDNNFTELSQSIFSLHGFTIITIPLSSLESTLLLLKNMEALETLSQINPEERESIIHTILQYQEHVSVQNAVNILMTEHSLTLSENQQKLPIDIKKAISSPQTKPIPFSLQQAKKLASKPDLIKAKMRNIPYPLSEKS